MKRLNFLFLLKYKFPDFRWHRVRKALVSRFLMTVRIFSHTSHRPHRCQVCRCTHRSTSFHQVPLPPKIRSQVLDFVVYLSSSPFLILISFSLTPFVILFSISSPLFLSLSMQLSRNRMKRNRQMHYMMTLVVDGNYGQARLPYQMGMNTGIWDFLCACILVCE